MPKVSKQDLYDDLKQLMVNKFDYGDELQSGDEGFENLLDTGTIADKEGKRIPFSQGRTERDRVDKLGDKLKKGYPLYIYKKGELYPHEVKYNKATGQIEVSEKTTKDMKPMEKPKKPGLLTRYFDLIARMFGGEIESCHKWREYCYQQDAIKNANDPKRVDRRLRNDSKLNQADRVENTSSRDTYRSFVSLLKNRLDYGKELNQDGNAGIKKLLEEGSIRDKNGNAIGAKSGSRDDLVSAIGERLYKKQEPLYVYKPGDEYPHEIYLNRNGQLKMSPVPINEMKNEMAKPDFLARVGNFFNRIVRWKSDSVFDYERSNIRRDLLSRFSRPEVLEQRRAFNKVKQSEQKEAEQKQPEAEQKQPEARENEEKVQKTPDIKSAGLENNLSSEKEQRGPGKDEIMSFLNRAGRTKAESGAAMNADWNAGESLHKNFVSELYDKNPQKAEIIGSRILKDGDSEELTKFQESLGKAQKALGEDGGKKMNELLEQFYDSGMSLADGAKIFSSDDPAAAMEDARKRLQKNGKSETAEKGDPSKEEALGKYNKFVNDQKDNEFGKDPEWQKGASTLGKFIGQLYDAMPDFVKNVIDALLGTAQPAAVNNFIKSAGHAQTTMNDPEGTKTASLMSDFFQSGKSLEEGTKAFNAADPAMEVDKMITPAKNMPENQPPIQEQSQPISQLPVQEQSQPISQPPVQEQSQPMSLEERLVQNQKSIQSLREQLAGLEKETQQLQKELKGIAGPSELEADIDPASKTMIDKLLQEDKLEAEKEQQQIKSDEQLAQQLAQQFEQESKEPDGKEKTHASEMQEPEYLPEDEPADDLDGLVVGEGDGLEYDPVNDKLVRFDRFDLSPAQEQVKRMTIQNGGEAPSQEIVNAIYEREAGPYWASMVQENAEYQQKSKTTYDMLRDGMRKENRDNRLNKQKLLEEEKENPVAEQAADNASPKKEQTENQKSEVEGLLDKLKAVNGGKELPATVKSNMQQLYDDAQAGKKALQDAIDSPDYDKFAGGNTVNAIAAYQFVKSSISGNYATPNMVAMIGEKNFVKDWQDYTKISPNVVYASNYPHSKEFFKEHVLSEKGTNELADSVSSGLDRVVSSNGKYTAEDVFWKSDIQAGLWHDADEKTEQKENKSEIKIGPKENSVKKDTAQKNNPDKNKQVQQNKPQQTQHQQPQQSAGMGALG